MATRQSNSFLDDKFEAYFMESRQDMVKFLPEGTKTLLDVGCGAGGFGRLLKASLPIEVWGVELNEPAALGASEYLDRVLIGSFPDGIEVPENYFDCIEFNDVLEHMIDPWTALAKAKKHLTKRGVVVSSIPNIRYLPMLYRLLIRGEWQYTPTGTLDKTHLRFFTKKSMLRMFDEAGYDVLHIEGIYPYRRWQVTVLGWVLPKFVNETKYIDYAIVARPKLT